MKRRKEMAEFNLLNEPWINVMTDDKGTTKEVSLKELFEHAHDYKSLAGETPTQDFAILRLLLAVLHTVFSRFDANGKQYEWVELDDNYKQTKPINEEDNDEYQEALIDTWRDLWEAKGFPKIVGAYLEKWRDRFYLFGGDNPFYQVTEDTLNLPVNKAKVNRISGKTIKRTLSESENKTILFSPEFDALKSKLRKSEISRWLVLYQSVTGTGDKVKFDNQDKDQKLSKGWLYDLGGVYVSGDDLFDTLLLNLALIHPEERYIQMQHPTWEEDSNEEMLHRFREGNMLDNLAALYTNWSRAIRIPDDFEETNDFSVSIIKLPEIDHQNNFLELMTEWRFNKTGDNKDTFTPKKHSLNEQFWRSFGITFTPNNLAQRRSGIIEWIIYLKDKEVILRHLKFNAVSMEDDGNATSWNPVNEIFDNVSFENVISNATDGWINLIAGEVDKIKIVIDGVLCTFATDIKAIRNLKSNEFANRIKQEAYFQIDMPFRDWLSNIQTDDSKEERIKEWRATLRTIIKKEAQKLIDSAGNRDFIGIEDGAHVKNIFTAYNRFNWKLIEYLPKEKE